MRLGAVTAILALACAPGPPSQDPISIAFHDGKVRLIAENVTVGRILEEWTRVGGTTFVGGDGLAGPPVTLQLDDVSESQALDVVLRGIAGFVITARATPESGRSHFDKVQMLPVTSRGQAPSGQPASAPQRTLREADTPPPDSDPGRPPGGQLGLREPEAPPDTEPSPADGPQRELRGRDSRPRGGTSKPLADVREVDAPPPADKP